MFIQEPKQGADARELWRVVAQCRDVLNALQNATGEIKGRINCVGRLHMTSGGGVFRFEEKTEVGSQGS